MNERVVARIFTWTAAVSECGLCSTGDAVGVCWSYNNNNNNNNNNVCPFVILSDIVIQRRNGKIDES
jgi:hypothetical protein